jgi:hypothetical protein
MSDGLELLASSSPSLGSKKRKFSAASPGSDSLSLLTAISILADSNPLPTPTSHSHFSSSDLDYSSSASSLPPNLNVHIPPSSLHPSFAPSVLSPDDSMKPPAASSSCHQ